MTINEAIRWTEKLAKGDYSKEEWESFLACVQSAGNEDMNRILDAYYTALGHEQNQTSMVGPGFIQRLSALRPQQEAVLAELKPYGKKEGRKRWMLAAAAVVILLFIISGLTYFVHDKKASLPVQRLAVQKDHAPGGNKAVLTLANGKQIVLDDATQGDIAQQAGVKIIKLDSGMIACTAPAGASGKLLPAYNTITTPRGGQYQLILPDGSHVWLNSASSLRFPNFFHGENRKVELTGEGYFEVAKNPSRPFIVSLADMEITVLGTHFNVMAYADEETVKTTLLEGSVKVKHGNNNSMIVPGQQASLQKGADQFTIDKANIDEVIAWKEGKFRFDEMNIHAIMRQIERWYDVQVEYSGNLKGITLTGVVPRKNYVSELLNALELTQRVHFTVTGDKITVEPYNK